MDKDNKNLRTHFFVLEINNSDEELNHMKEYFFLQKSLLETYYLNIIDTNQFDFLLNSFQKISSRTDRLAVKPKGFFIYLPKWMYSDFEQFKNKEKDRLAKNFVTLLETLEHFSKSMHMIIFRVKFQVEGGISNPCFSMLVTELIKVLNKFKDFNFIIETSRSFDEQGIFEVKKFLKLKFGSLQKHHTYSLINFYYEKKFESENYKLILDKNSIAFYNFLYSCYATKKSTKKLYKKKAILLQIQKFFFLTYHEIVEDPKDFKFK